MFAAPTTHLSGTCLSGVVARAANGLATTGSRR
jgi:hypothetical protein